MRGLALLFAFMPVAISIAAADDDWWNGDWKYRQRVTINASELKEDLINFPLGIRLGGAQWGPSRLAPDGHDLRVVAPDKTLLEYELVRCDADALELYARMPRIVAGAVAQHVDIYYGNPAAPPVEKAKVYDEHYRMVLHFADSLVNTVTGQTAATPEGKVAIDKTAAFNDEKCYLTLDPKLLDGLGEQITLAVRFRQHGGPAVQTLVSGLRKDGPEEWFNFGIKTPNTIHTNATSHGQRAPELNPVGIAPDEWHSAIVVYDARNHTRTICIDGTVLERDSALPGPLAIDDMRIGRGVLHFDPWQFHGEIDEVRLSDVARSDSWIRAEAAGLADKNTVIAIGPPQEIGGATPPPAAFDLLAPADGAQIRKRSGALLKWHPSAGAASYTVEFYDSADGEKPASTADAGAATSLAVPVEKAAGKTIWWTVVAKSSVGKARATAKWKLNFYDWSNTMASIPEEKEHPALNPAKDASFELTGFLRKRIDKSIQRYFLETPESSPAILQVLRDRDKSPVRDPLVPWAGEFAGKYLTGGQLVWRVTHDAALKQTLDEFVRDLIACQGPDGYLGPFPQSSRLTGGNWDVWGHYHCMLGLMFYYEDTRYEPALDACKKAADLLFETFGPGGPTLTCDGSGGQMNMAICHAMVLLYKKTGIQRYLDLANYVINDAWNEEGAGKYLESALAGKPVHEFPQHRWEALHDYQTLPEMYWLTGDDRYSRAYKQIWTTGLEGDRHNTGGVTSGEGFCGSPYNQGPIETCCTVAWIAFAVDMLRLSGDSRVADEIEWSTLNSALGAIPYSGRVCAYNTPMDGTRTFGVELPWQSPKAGPDLNCCAVNAYRPLGMISQWALMERDNTLALNFYGAGTLSATLPSGNKVSFTEETNYPIEGRVSIKMTLDKPETFRLDLRIPKWSNNTCIKISRSGMIPDPPIDKIPTGKYLPLEQEWKTGDMIEITFDFTLHFWAGENECAGKISIYRGPLLYAYDARYNDLNPDQLPTIDWPTAKLEDIKYDGKIEPWVLAVLKDKTGAEIKVCDFASAGQTGNQYRSWLPAKNVPRNFGEKNRR